MCFGLASFLAGLVLARRLYLDGWTLLLTILLTPLLFRLNKLSLLSIIVIGLMLGCWRGSIFLRQIAPYSVLARQQVHIVAVAKTDAVYGQRSQLEFDVGNIELHQPYPSGLVGTIGVGGFGEPMIYRGDKVEVAAKLYPTRGARQARMSYAKIRKIESGRSAINKLRRKFAASLQSVLPEPLSSLGLGILLGQRTTLPDSLDEDLSRSGLTHIVAVSGYNLTILVQLAHRWLRNRSKYQATVLTLSMITLFLILTGSSASIVRAAVVSGLSIWAGYYGRTIKPTLLILLVAVLTAGWFPPYLWSDLGWHLSFLAFIGILLLAPLVTKRFWTDRQPKLVARLVIETSCAQLMTMPIIMYIFGRVSAVSLVANMLVVPLVPLAMALSFTSGIAGILAPAIAGWLAWPARILLLYQVDMIGLTARLPNAAIDLSLSLWQLVLFYLLILLVGVVWWKRLYRNGRITDRTQTGADYEWTQ